MIQPTPDTYQFHLGRLAYKRTRMLAWLMFSGFLIITLLALTISIWMGGTYDHGFTFYLKWQDALVSLLCFIAFLTLGGNILVLRFLRALHGGYTEGMLTLVGNSVLMVRDLSPLNLASVFWIMHSAFWCFVAALVGLSPLILIQWTLHIANPALAVLVTAIAVILSIAGVVVSVVALTFIMLGCIGLVSFTRKLGAPQKYTLSNQTTLRIDNFVLTIIHPGTAETMVDLKLLDQDDQRTLLSLLHERWIDAEQAWNPTLGEEIAAALRVAERSIVLV
jgi:hypothetical protein